MSNLYLKDLIGMTSDGTLTARIGSIGQVQENKNGKKYRKVEFVFPATGKTHEEGVFEFNFTGPRASLAGLKVGDMIETKLDGDWPVFKILSSDAENTVQPSQTNSGQVKSERAATNGIKEQEEKSIAICLQGFMQAYISNTYKAGLNDSHEQIIVDSVSFAAKAREACLNKAKSIYNS